MRKRPLTARQASIVEYIRDYTSECRYPPTMRDIAAWFGISEEGVRHHLAALEKKGVVHRDVGTNRSLRVVEKTQPRENTPPAV